MQELFRQYSSAKEHVLKFSSNFCVCVLHYESFLHSKILALGVSEVICHGLKQLLGLQLIQYQITVFQAEIVL